jgi:hypothetical protein
MLRKTPQRRFVLMLTIQLYASACPRNDFYLERVQEIADRLGLDYTAEKVTDESAIARAGLEVTCLESYCPGCRAQHADTKPEERFTPALAVNGALVFWNIPASDEDLEQLFLQY